MSSRGTIDAGMYDGIYIDNKRLKEIIVIDFKIGLPNINFKFGSCLL